MYHTINMINFSYLAEKTKNIRLLLLTVEQ